MLTTMIIAALIGYGVGLLVELVAWTISCLANWVFSQFKTKNTNVDANITIKDPQLLNEVVGGIYKKNPELGDRMNRALFGGEPKALSVFTANGQATEVSVLQAHDASRDEVGDKILRFGRYDRTIREY